MMQPPETYDVTITVESDDATLTVKMPGIKRSDILAPSYGNPGVASIVKMLEDSVE